MRDDVGPRPPAYSMSGTTAHRRVSSSLRLNIPQSPPTLKNKNSSSSGWLQQSSSNLSTRRAIAHYAKPRNIALTTLCILLILLYYNDSPARSNGSIARVFDPSALLSGRVKNPGKSAKQGHKVDREMMAKLKWLDEKLRTGVDDEYEAQVALPPAKVNGKPRFPPIVEEIPDKKATIDPYNTKNEEVYAPDPSTLTKSVELDTKTCPGQFDVLGNPKCAFLLPAWVGEQETKAQQHLYQMGLLALALNRTLVLPNVHRSRLFTCGIHPFSFYYDQDSLAKLGIKTITFEDFNAWSQHRDALPTAQIINIANAKSDYPSGALEVEAHAQPSLIPGKPARGLCLKPPSTWLDFDFWSPISVYPPSGWHKTESSRASFGQSLINTISSTPTLSKSFRTTSPIESHSIIDSANVLAFNYELRFPLFTPETLASAVISDAETETDLSRTVSAIQPFSHFPYAPLWHELTDLLTSSMPAPYIALHWRQETIPPSQISPCASALLSKIAALKKTYPSIQGVYFATDYPLEDLDSGREGIAPHSGTFAKIMTEENHRAMRQFMADYDQQFGKAGLKMYTLSRLQDNIQLPSAIREKLSPAGSNPDADFKLDLGVIDSGLLGIVDKNILMQAPFFLAASPWTTRQDGKDGCGKESSFTRQIVEDRRARMENELADQEEGRSASTEATLWNDIEHWSLVKEEPTEEEIVVDR